jgi:hypothetical protein
MWQCVREAVEQFGKKIMLALQTGLTWSQAGMQAVKGLAHTPLNCAASLDPCKHRQRMQPVCSECSVFICNVQYIAIAVDKPTDSAAAAEAEAQALSCLRA